MERELTTDGPRRFLTVFLRGAECRFACTHCDLWRHTHAAPTLGGAVPEQISRALEEARRSGRAEHTPASGSIWGIKLYNASSYFQSSAVPPEDDAAVIELVSGFEQVVVEAHPLLVGRRCLDVARRLGGKLQVALGLETADARVLARLNKHFELSDYELACRRLRDAHVSIRVFLLVGLPFVDSDQAQRESVARSIEYAVDHGADVVSLIPLRGGNGVMDELAATGSWRTPTLSLVEQVIEDVFRGPGHEAVVQVDPWDLGQLAECSACDQSRRKRLVEMSRDGCWRERVACSECRR